MSEIYDFEVNDIDQVKIKLDEYKGKTILIVNVASACGFTPQYEGLQSMYEKYKDKGLEILAFPCNQFGGQESGTNEEIKNFCDTRYKVSFKLFDKVEVKGENASPLFNFLTEKAGREIQWNFTKFLRNSALGPKKEPRHPLAFFETSEEFLRNFVEFPKKFLMPKHITFLNVHLENKACH